MNYGSALPPGFEVPSSYRWVLAKDLGGRNPFAAVEVRAGDRVMDCGACIGTFAAAAFEAGAHWVNCYEPFPPAAATLHANLRRYGARCAIVEAALVADGEVATTLFTSGFPGAHSVVARPLAKQMLTVKAVNFRSELRLVEPHVLKLDVEGAEYQLMLSLQPGDLADVRCVFIEFHPVDDAEPRRAAVLEYLAREGFRVANKRWRAFTAVKEV